MNSWWLIAALVAPVLPPQAVSSGTAAPGTLVVHGEVSALVDVFPKQEQTRELRTRALIDVSADPKAWLRLRFKGAAEGLVADRSGRVDAASADVLDAWVEIRSKDVEVRAGYGTVVWGRLDEVMPSDVINPIDTAKFFLEGRADARLPVAFVRSRLFLPSETSIEAVAALPGRRGRFDNLGESSSPFNLLNDLVLPAGLPAGITVAQGLRRETPPTSWGNLQGGLRVSTTAGRVDMSVSAWRGFEGFGLINFETRFDSAPGVAVVGELVERYPRFTMVAADVETVLGGWAIRGEVAAFVDKTLSGPLGTIEGKAVDAGLGLDRSAGQYHFFGSLVWHHEWAPASSLYSKKYLNVIGSVDRRFAREQYLARVFVVLNPDDRSGFVRGLMSWSVRDNVLLEGSGGVFLGEGADAIGRFSERDFAFVRVRYSF